MSSLRSALPATFPARLSDGYLAFRDGRFRQENERYRRLAEEGQNPSIMIIGCSDSRVSPEVIFDAGPGEIFVERFGQAAMERHDLPELTTAAIRHLNERAEVIIAPLELVVPLQLILKLARTLGELVCVLNVVPEIGRRHLVFQRLNLLFDAFGVKRIAAFVQLLGECPKAHLIFVQWDHNCVDSSRSYCSRFFIAVRSITLAAR